MELQNIFDEWFIENSDCLEVGLLSTEVGTRFYLVNYCIGINS